MITPIITSLSREVIATVPAIDKEGAYALGATRWEMIRGAVWPHSQAGVVSAILVGLGRAMGETIAAALVIGSSVQVTSHLFVPGYSIPAVIANQFGESSGEFRSALIGLGLVLFVLTIIVNLIARAVVERSTRRQQGGLMAAVSDQPTIDLREPGGWRRSKNQIATGLMYLAFVIILIPLGLVIFEVIAKGAKAISWQFLTNSTIPPNVMPLGQGGMGAAVVGTLEITAFAALHRGAARHPRRGLHRRVRRQELAGQAGLVHGRRDGRRAVDRDGPVHLHRLGDPARAHRDCPASRARSRSPA